MDPIQALLIENACLRLLTEYTVATDWDDAAMWLDVFTDDAVWEAPNLKLEGRPAFEKFFAARTNRKSSLVRHFSANALVKIQDADHATSVSTMLVFRQADYPGSGPGALKTPTAIVQNDDEFVRGAKGWKIKRRVTSLAFAAAP
jgi:ketosteroid isomerase-like protein